MNVGPIPLHKSAKTTKKAILTGVDTFKKLALSAKSHEIPTYSYFDAVARAFMANQFHGQEFPITQEDVEILMKRGLRKVSEDKYTWTADLRDI